MNRLTLIVPNRDRMGDDNNSTKLWLKSIKNQSFTDFDVIVIDGGSRNFDKLKIFLENNNVKVMQHILNGKFHKSLLNNIAIRSIRTEYIMASDADMFFARDFFKTIDSILSPDYFIESRSMYLGNVVNNLYDGKFDLTNDLESYKVGRIKKRSTPGGCQCGHRDIWNKIRGYDERYVGWGSEDVDLIKRVGMAGYPIKWIGEDRESIMLFHQQHNKIDVKEDLRDQDKNLVLYRNVKEYAANSEKWGEKQ